MAKFERLFDQRTKLPHPTPLENQPPRKKTNIAVDKRREFVAIDISLSCHDNHFSDHKIISNFTIATKQEIRLD